MVYLVYFVIIILIFCYGAQLSFAGGCSLTAEAVGEVHNASKRIHNAVEHVEAVGWGNRNPGRYSLGSLSGPGQCFHIEAFVKHLVNNGPVLDALDEIFPSSDGSPG